MAGVPRGRRHHTLQKFAKEYIASRGNAAEAARKAGGYSKKQSKMKGKKMLDDPRVQEMLSRATLETSAEAQVRAVDVLKAMMEIAYADPGDVFEPSIVKMKNGTTRTCYRLKDILEMPKAVRRCISSIKVVKRNLVAGDGETDEIYEVKWWDKPKMLDSLATHLGLLNLKVEHTVTVQAMEKMNDQQLTEQVAKDLEAWKEQMELRAKSRLAIEVTSTP